MESKGTLSIKTETQEESDTVLIRIQDTGTRNFGK